MIDKKIEQKKIHKSLFILPSFFTLLNMIMGYYAIIAALDSKWIVSAVVITIAVLMDGLDGRIARFTNTTTEFGLNFDSIVDVISFGVAPAVVAYLYCLRNLTDFKHLGWLLSFIFVAAGAIRLARFNVYARTDMPNTYFIGLPIPGAAGLLSTIIWIYERFLTNIIIAQNYKNRIFVITVLILSVLMISKVRYYSFKKVKILYKKPIFLIITIFIVLYLLFVYPSILLFSIGFLYVISGPIRTIFSYQDILIEKILFFNM
ncbi:MAG TPA: CDP-diacylglycerol--serine O-phosphatidyltransferase, partial [bacterium]|nr:CDP-diacylglycerol--serine O-phosphatidyltransferase [bacterium]